MNDENEIIKASCPKNCDKAIEGTYKELFGSPPGLHGLPKFTCRKCGSVVVLEMTGKYKK